MTDIEIAQAATPQPISAIAQKAGVPEQYLEQYGTTKAKVDYNLLRDEQHTPGKLVLVTAINPTPAGEGKTTTTVGLADALQKRGKNPVVALREPSLGPVFGIKGGAAGGGYAQVVPMEDAQHNQEPAISIAAEDIQGLELSGDTNTAMPQIHDSTADTNANEEQAQAS